MGYLKGGSQKSLMAGGVSASLLLVVFKLLPNNPVLASSLGLGKESTVYFLTSFVLQPFGFGKLSS